MLYAVFPSLAIILVKCLKVEGQMAGGQNDLFDSGEVNLYILNFATHIFWILVLNNVLSQKRAPYIRMSIYL